MDLSDRLTDLGKKVTMLRDTVKTEEATKNALIMPFISALGYDVFNPAEVVPEFSAAIGEYKDARVDYAILSGERPILLIECKALGTPLDMKHCNQLQLYFHGTDAPIAVLTDGNNYKFFS
ncbi:MAG: type I restriction enzyme HsdR N-terminal domain-containing protein, partial [Desulfovibrionaceae bacterium]|nr:type I restriction enzyme HsdR N-terminal domain-containing protein [Desulfovibrionaceae bacterium]